MGEFVRLEVQDGVGVIRLDRPPANAIDLQVGLELQDAIHEAEASERVGAHRRVGRSEDLRGRARTSSRWPTWGPEEVRPSVDALGDAADLLERIPKVSIAAVNGYALGGGLELALGCDLRYLAEDASVGQPEIRLGVIPGAGGTQRLTQLIGPGLTRRLVYTGEQVDAAAAERLGIAERVLPADDVLPQAVRDARAIAEGPRQAIAAAKSAIRAAIETPGPDGIRRERELFLDLFGTHDQREGMRAFLEKRQPRFG